MSKVTKLGVYSQDGSMLSPLDALEECRKDIENDKVNPNKILILSLSDKDGDYTTSFWQAGMSCSQMISLMEVMKHVFITDHMGF